MTHRRRYQGPPALAPMSRILALLIVNVMEQACSLTRHAGACWLLNRGGGRLFGWAFRITFPPPDPLSEPWGDV